MFSQPPATSPRPAVSRRDLLRLGAAGSLLAGAPLAAQTFGSGFTHGVASGEPGAERVLIWTRFVAAQDTQLRWELSEVADFARIAAGGEVLAGPTRDWCCKAWADGLAPGRWYYFRFIAPDGTASVTGRTRTLPVGETASFRMAMFSCSNLRFGWFNAYAHAAADNSFECALHLGDYLYEYPAGAYPSEAQALAGREIWPASEIVQLADYRLRHASYRADRDLQRLHQVMPMIAVWDDHESANDSWKGGAQNHQSETEGDWEARKRAAMQAYREWMPVSDEPWAAYQIGDLATLFRLETRLTARDKPLDLAALLRGQTSREAAQAALVALRDGSYADPARELLGGAQQAWLAEGMRASRRSGAVWQVLVQQVLMGVLRSPPELMALAGQAVAPAVLPRLQAAAAASSVGLPSNMDAWDGYPAARDKVFAAALEAEANLVSLAGDTHNAWAFNLDRGGERVGVEFGTSSVTSPGFESSLSTIAPADLARSLRVPNPQLAWVDTSRRGYVAFELTREAATSEYRLLDTVRQRSTTLAATHTMRAAAGARRLG